MNGFPAVADPVNVSRGPFGWPTRTVTGLYRSNGYPDPLRDTPAVKLLREAVFYIDAANSVAGERCAINQGTGGPALNACYGGNIGAASTNDPLLLTKRADEPNYLYSPEATVSYLSIPDAAALTPTTSLDVRTVVAPDDWTPAADRSLAGQYSGTTDRAWYLVLRTGSGLQFVHSVDGANNLSPVSTVALSSVVSLTDGKSPLAIRVLWDAASPSVQFFWKQSGPLTAYADASDDAGWTQLGATVTGATVGASIFNSATVVALAGRGPNAGSGAKHHATVIKVDGTLQAGFNAAVDVASSSALSFPITTGQTATLTQATAGRKAVLVTRPCWLFGTDDYLEVPNHPLLDMANNQSFTVLAVIRQWATPLSSGWIVAKRASSGQGWVLRQNTTTQGCNFFVEGSPSQSVAGSASTAGALRTFIGMRKVAAISAHLNNTPTAGAASTDTSGTLSNILPVRLGCRSDAAATFQEFELVAAAIFRRALTTTEIATINTHFGT